MTRFGTPTHDRSRLAQLRGWAAEIRAASKSDRAEMKPAFLKDFLAVLCVSLGAFRSWPRFTYGCPVATGQGSLRHISLDVAAGTNTGDRNVNNTMFI